MRTPRGGGSYYHPTKGVGPTRGPEQLTARGGGILAESTREQAPIDAGWGGAILATLGKTGREVE